LWRETENKEGWPGHICFSGVVNLLEMKGVRIPPAVNGDRWQIEFIPSHGPLYYSPASGNIMASRDGIPLKADIWLNLPLSPPQAGFLQRYGRPARYYRAADLREDVFGFDLEISSVGEKLRKA
jgi:hypothetical protein